MRGAGGFRASVYALVARIPAGRVMGYGHVAAAIGVPGAARQVGYALAALPPERDDVPWQRVVRSSGHLAFAGDPVRGSRQRALLQGEGVPFLGDRVDMARAGWIPDTGR
jgi:methylated-DNA-protein-cysteine methyltransferase-like protein